jgi:hypothetical protein
LLVAASLSFAATAFGLNPTTTANDDSCDIALLPAATLLLPYFAVDVDPPVEETTLFSITNVTNVAQVVRVTLWTDLSYPVLSFNVFLTGYDVQSINLFDVIARGAIGNGAGTGSSTSHQGSYSDPNSDIDLTNCAALPGRMPIAFVERMQLAFSEGRIVGGASACDQVGGVHEHMVGYATIDVVGNCSTATPADPQYFTNDIRYDNVLIGDYQHISNGIRTDAQVSPLVHIRAVPEGGTPTSRLDDPDRYANRFANTFYGRFQTPATPTADARQPLPSRFAVRWVNGGPGEFETYLEIWRQSFTGRNIACNTLDDNWVLEVADSVVFDENENGEGIEHFGCSFECVGPEYPFLPSTSWNPVIPGSEIFPQVVLSNSSAGWLYLNLDDHNPENGAHQNWVVVSMRAQGRYSGDMDGAALGNGCSAPLDRSEASEDGSVIIGPSSNSDASNTEVEP